ncbi:MAG: class I SAM-dependent methyltransferase [Owenweeksia sp.]
MTTPAKYDKIGVGYNRTRQADPYLTERIYHLLQAIEGKHYLDVGCGTGNYTCALHKREVRLTGVDPSLQMLEKAREKSSSINWLEGSVENLPLEDNFFDGAIATLTLHHWQNLNAGFSEIKRVLKAQSPLVIFTSTPAQMQTYWLNHYFPGMMATSTKQMPSLEEVTHKLRENGLSVTTTEKYFVKDDLQDLFLQSGKNKPDLYFEPQVRSGISSFAALSNATEVELGLKLLANDIHTGNIRKIIKQYESDEGDYLFILAHT